MILRFTMRGAAVALVVAVAAWFALEAGGLLVANPFAAAKHAASVEGGWAPDEVEFQRGTYEFRGFYTVTRARLLATTACGTVPVDISLTHVPLRGWSVEQFRASPPCGDEQVLRRKRAA